MKRNRLRRWIRVIHRDLGYLCVGLTLVYAISGVAVNHAADWNPNLHVEHQEFDLGPMPGASAEQVLVRLDLPPDHKSTFRRGPGQLQIFLEDGEVAVDLRSGRGRLERSSTRPILYETNFLHLNHPKRAWTWVADAFAVSLALLALTGLFMIKGKKGFAGRGKWLTAAGVAIPLWFWWLYL